MSKKIITLLSGADQITTGHELVGLLFECAPDSEAFQCAKRVIPLAELIGDFAETKRKAFDLARKLLDDEPAYRGIQQLGIFEEVVLRQLQHAFHSIHLHRALDSLDIDICRFSSRTATMEGLREIHSLTPCSYRLDEAFRPATSGRLTSRVLRVLNRLRETGFSPSGIRAEWRQFLNVVDPYHRRAVFSSKADNTLQGGGIWYYSTSYTISRIGMMYEPFFPEKFTYLIENPHTGGRALTEAGRELVNLHVLGKSSFRSSKKEIDQSREGIIRHLESVEISNDDEVVARNILLNGGFFRQFLDLHLPVGLYFVALFESLLNTWQPRAVVVGNPVVEGYLLHQARKRQIPTVLLQHGILGDYCQFSDPPADYYIVRGSFWREFLAELPRERSVILNPPQTHVREATTEDKSKHILFLTAPYSCQEFFNEMDLDEILGYVLEAAAVYQTTVVVRVHPSEKVEYYRNRVEKLKRRINVEFDVQLSHGYGLEEVVRNAYVAVTFSSTVFLDCLRYGVPIVSFGWHDFSYKQQLEHHRAFHFAQTLAELNTLVGKAIEGLLPPCSGRIEHFLADSNQIEITDFFSRLSPK